MGEMRRIKKHTVAVCIHQVRQGNVKGEMLVENEKCFTLCMHYWNTQREVTAVNEGYLFYFCFKAQYAMSAEGTVFGFASAEHVLVQSEVELSVCCFTAQYAWVQMRRVRWLLSNEEYRFFVLVQQSMHW